MSFIRTNMIYVKEIPAETIFQRENAQASEYRICFESLFNQTGKIKNQAWVIADYVIRGKKGIDRAQ